MSSLAALLHDDTDRIVVSGSKKVGTGKSWFNRYVHDTRHAEIVAASIANGGRNVYCKHGLHDGTLNDQRRPLCTSNHFVGSRTFFIDIDVAHGNGYSTDKDAIKASRTALNGLRALGIPRPNVWQSTGAGLQAVWAVENVLSADEWRRTNRILFLLAAKCGLDRLDQNLQAIDKAVRYCGPKFLNVNHDKPRPTQVLWFNPQRVPNEQFVDVLLRHGQLRAVPSQSKRGSFNDRFKVAGTEFELDLDSIVDECAILGEAIETEGKEHGYELWTDLLALASKNGDEDYGRLLAHQVSKGHPDYDAEVVDGKFDGFRASDNKKYVTCERFAQSYAASSRGSGKTQTNLCATCAYYKKVNSPAGIQGKMRALAQARGETPVDTGNKILGGEYFNSKHGIHRKKRGEEEINPVVWPLVNANNLILSRTDVNPQEEMLTFDMSSHDGSWMRRIDLPVAMLHSNRTSAKALGDQQVPIADRYHKPIQEAMVSWLQELRARKEHRTKYTRLGWTSDQSSFVLGPYVYHANGTRENIFTHDPAMDAFDMKGDESDFREMVNLAFAEEKRPEAHALIAASLGAILIPLVGAAGMALNFYSARSGYGKTTLSQIAGSLWGNHRNLTFTLDDTENSIMRRISVLNNLPALHDEMRMDKDAQEKVLRMIFRLNSMVEKSRMHADASLQQRGEWRTLMLFTTNYSFLDLARNNRKLGGEPAIARVLDFIMPPLPSNAASMVHAVSQRIANLEHCNGWVGHKWVSHVVANRVSIRNKVFAAFKLLMKYSNSINKGGMFSRNHCFACATMLVSAAEAREHGIIPLDKAHVSTAVLRALDLAHNSRDKVMLSSDPMKALRDYMQAHEGYTIIVHPARTKNGQGYTIDERIKFLQPARVEVNHADSKFYVDADHLEHWLLNGGYACRNILLQLERFRLPAPRPLGQGTVLHLAPIDTLGVDMADFSAGMKAKGT